MGMTLPTSSSARDSEAALMPDASVVARLETDEATAHRITDLIAESYGPEEAAAGIFDSGGGRWGVALHFRARPNQIAVRALVALAAGAEAANALGFTTLAAKDWVKA